MINANIENIKMTLILRLFSLQIWHIDTYFGTGRVTNRSL